MTKEKVALVLLPPFWPNLPPLNLAILKGFLAACGLPAETIDLNNIFFAQPANKLQQ